MLCYTSCQRYFSIQKMNNECITVPCVAQGFGHLRTYQEDWVLYDNTGSLTVEQSPAIGGSGVFTDGTNVEACFSHVNH